MIALLTVLITSIGYVFILIYFGLRTFKDFIKVFFSLFKKH